MGALNRFWQAKEVEVSSKYLIYMTILLNIFTMGL